MTQQQRAGLFKYSASLMHHKWSRIEQGTKCLSQGSMQPKKHKKAV